VTQRVSERGPWLPAVLVCVVLNMLDGFDVLVISIVSPLISAEWHLTGQQLGELLSAGVTGMVLGSVGCCDKEMNSVIDPRV